MARGGGAMDETMQMLVDLHRGADRLGPGTEAATRRALALAGLEGRAGLAVADIGCGTGAATRVLAAALDADVVAIDLVGDFLATLVARLGAEGLADRVTTLEAPMEALPIAPGSLDAIVSEGAIYNMGFEAGLAAWRPLLKPGGVLAVSELSWLTATRPAGVEAFWQAGYPGIGPVSARIAALEAAGYAPLGFFPLGAEAWAAYHDPLEAALPAFLARHPGSSAAKAVAEETRQEIAIQRAHADVVSYGFYVARRHHP